MKTDKYQPRFYRGRIKAKGLFLTRIVNKETDLQVLTDKKTDIAFIEERVSFYRRQVESYIAKDKRFLGSLKPISVELNSPLIVRKMAKEAHAAGVGPMACVAGAIAEFIGRDLLRRGYKEVIIENGGDIFLKIKKTRAVGIYSGKSKKFSSLSLRIKPKDTPLGICTSSGTIGHSLSFGAADSAVVLAKDAVLADAAATAACNRIQSKDGFKDALDSIRCLKGVKAALFIIKNKLLAWGKIEFIE